MPLKGKPAERAIIARRLADLMTRDVIFASSKAPVFHGDPHAGNVFHVTGNSSDPYQIALLDWGLYGTFPREDRVALMQLILGVQLKDAKRLHNNVGGLLAGGMPADPQRYSESMRSSPGFSIRRNGARRLERLKNCWSV